MDGFYRWATGGDREYKTLLESLNGDVGLTVAIVSICTAIGVGYLVIAARWFRSARSLSPSDAKDAMNSLMWIFVLCAISGYLWPLIKLRFPVWRVQVGMLAVLCLHTWNFVLHPRWMRGVAEHMSERDRLLSRNQEILRDLGKLKALYGGGTNDAGGLGAQ